MNGRTLAHAMGNILPRQRYDQLAPSANEALVRAHCTTVARAAMFLAQIGHESVGLRYTEEIASGSNYEGRADLGNTQRGDGVRFKGRCFIQVTGRHNYGKLSEWGHAKGYLPDPRYFVNHPAKLADDEHAWLGAVWYWTVARPMNQHADAKDLVAATRAVNGGLNGLDSRRVYYERCMRLGRAILPTTTTAKDKPVAEYAPAALKAMFNTVQAAIPVAKFGGILGDRAHTYGYHRGRRYVTSSDYSAQHPDDKAGDPEAASALDITLPAEHMKAVTARLIRATKAGDPRLRAVREFFGTVNGRDVTGMDVRDRRWCSSDPSHLWHVHVSVYRRWANDHAALQQAAGVIIGTKGKDELVDMNREDVEELIATAMRAYHIGGDRGPFTREKYPVWVKDEKDGVADRLTRLERKVK